MNNAALDVAIGLIMMYLVLSLLCTVINEFIATIARLRATTLEKSLRQIIDVPTLKADFYNHGLIDGGKAINGDSHTSYLSGDSFAMALLGSLDTTKSTPTFHDMAGSIKHLPDSNIRDTLLVHLTASDGEIKKLRYNIAVWFDHTMNRVSGVYKRKLKVISSLVGIILALLINADSIEVSKALWHDRALRAQMTSSVTGLTSDNIQPVSKPTVADIVRIESEIRPLPVGWGFTYSGITWHSFISKIAGILITGLALSLGAPFWFDLLSRFVNIRGSGNPPETTINTGGNYAG